jgi:hypothetical protein
MQIVRSRGVLMPKVVSVFGIEPFRMAVTKPSRENFLQLGQQGWESVLVS